MMAAVLIVIEGLDGAGKRTLTAGLQRALEADGKSVTTLAFPRYGQSIHADLASEALHGRHGDLASSVYAMATLFALDRAGAIDHIADLRRRHDVVILDRYVASNAAYSAARLHQDAAGEAVSWVGCAFVLTSAICLTILSGAAPGDRSDLIRLVATEGACAASWTLIGVAITAMVIRERQLFTFFKGR